MTREIEVRANQTLDDIAKQYYGSVRGIADILKNNKDIRESAFPIKFYNGQKVIISDDNVDVDSLSILRSENAYISSQTDETRQDGIGYDYLDIDSYIY